MEKLLPLVQQRTAQPVHAVNLFRAIVACLRVHRIRTIGIATHESHEPTPTRKHETSCSILETCGGRS